VLALTRLCLDAFLRGVSVTPAVHARHTPEQEEETVPDNGSKPSLNGDNNHSSSPDPLAEAEGIRSLLAEAQSRTTRLIASLKQFRRQSRAVRAAVDSLRELPPLTP
jgi:hypothetical protein